MTPPTVWTTGHMSDLQPLGPIPSSQPKPPGFHFQMAEKYLIRAENAAPADRQSFALAALAHLKFLEYAESLSPTRCSTG